MKGEALSWTHSSSPQRGREARVNPQSQWKQWPQANGPGETAPQLAQRLGGGRPGEGRAGLGWRLPLRAPQQGQQQRGDARQVCSKGSASQEESP